MPREVRRLLAFWTSISRTSPSLECGSPAAAFPSSTAQRVDFVAGSFSPPPSLRVSSVSCACQRYLFPSFQRSVALSVRMGLSALFLSTPVLRLYFVATTYFLSEGYSI